MFENLFKKKAAPVAAELKTPLLAPSVTAPVAAAPVSSAPVSTAKPDKPSATGTVKDVTLRPVVLGINKDLTMTNNPTGKGKVISNPVPSDQFNNYTHALKIMAQLARIVYCDLSVIREVVIGDKFGKDDNPAVNTQITQLDSKYSSMRRTPVDPAKNEGRPMQSYATPLCSPDQVQPAGSEVLTYVSSPSDVTFLIVGGKQLRDKSGIAFFKDDDLVICFKGSSTMKNFKHDLYSQFNATDLNELVQPAGLKLTDNPVGKVTGAFVKPLIKVWATLKREIASKNPRRLFITGHSLGGAYASMFAFIVAECHGSVFPSIQTAHLITFGAPTLLSDTARNTFNKYLDNGFLTLDRVVSQAKTLVIDAIPSIPAGFTHPGYQPLKTEFFVEEKTGRAYQLKNIEGVFKKQSGGNKRTKKGGGFFSGPEKTKYEAETKTHMPTKIMIYATDPKSQGFPHAEYWGMTYFGGFRMTGMKNPGYKGNTFVGRVYLTCISYAYEPANPTEEVVTDPDSNNSITDQVAPVVNATDEAAPASTPVAATTTTSAAPVAAPATTTTSAAPVAATTTSATPAVTTPVAATTVAAAPAPATTVAATTTSATPAATNVPATTTSATPVAATTTSAAPVAATTTSATPVAATNVPATTTSATPVAATTTSATAAPVAATTTSAAPTAATTGGRKSRKHRRGNKGRRVSRRKHRKSHAMLH
jgi:hypothetical protein